MLTLTPSFLGGLLCYLPSALPQRAFERVLWPPLKPPLRAYPFPASREPLLAGSDAHDLDGHADHIGGTFLSARAFRRGSPVRRSRDRSFFGRVCWLYRMRRAKTPDLTAFQPRLMILAPRGAPRGIARTSQAGPVSTLGRLRQPPWGRQV
jgi:hypothetical protein